MLGDFHYDFFKESHAFQIDQIENLRDRIAQISGQLVLLGSAVVYLITHYHSVGYETLDRAFYIFIGIASLYFLFSVGLALSCLLRDFRYQFTPTSTDILKYVEDLDAWNETVPLNQKVNTDQRLKEHLIRQYASAAAHNLKLNAFRSDMLLRSNRIAVTAVLPLLFATIPFIISEVKKTDKPTKVQIVTPVTVNLGKGEQK